MGMASFSRDAGAALGIGALLASLVCLGTWPALLRLCTWAAGEERAASISLCGRKISPNHRHVCHVYIDYALSYVASSSLPILLSLAIRRIFSAEHEGVIEWKLPLVIIAMFGGAVLALGNLSMQWSTSVFGAPLTTVLAIQASLTVVLGTSINYLLEPQRTARPELLASGVLVFLLAIAFATLAQTWYGVSITASARNNRAEYTECGEIDDSQHHDRQRPGLIALPTLAGAKTSGEESFYSDDENSSLRGENVADGSTQIGLFVAFVGGLCFGFFSPAFNIAVNDPFAWSSAGLSVALANIWFSVAFAVSSILGNVKLMRNPPLHSVPQSTIRSYLHEVFRERRVALLAGLVCALGNVLQFQGGKLAGFATADLVQAFPLVATMWDVMLFGEFRRATKQVLVALMLMYITYLLGIVLLASSIGIRMRHDGLH